MHAHVRASHRTLVYSVTMVLANSRSSFVNRQLSITVQKERVVYGTIGAQTHDSMSEHWKSTIELLLQTRKRTFVHTHHNSTARHNATTQYRSTTDVHKCVCADTDRQEALDISRCHNNPENVGLFSTDHLSPLTQPSPKQSESKHQSLVHEICMQQ